MDKLSDRAQANLKALSRSEDHKVIAALFHYWTEYILTKKHDEYTINIVLNTFNNYHCYELRYQNQRIDPIYFKIYNKQQRRDITYRISYVRYDYLRKEIFIGYLPADLFLANNDKIYDLIQVMVLESDLSSFITENKSDQIKLTQQNRDQVEKTDKFAEKFYADKPLIFSENHPLRYFHEGNDYGQALFSNEHLFEKKYYRPVKNPFKKVIKASSYQPFSDNEKKGLYQYFFGDITMDFEMDIYYNDLGDFTTTNINPILKKEYGFQLSSDKERINLSEVPTGYNEKEFVAKVLKVHTNQPFQKEQEIVTTTNVQPPPPDTFTPEEIQIINEVDEIISDKTPINLEGEAATLMGDIQLILLDMLDVRNYMKGKDINTQKRTIHHSVYIHNQKKESLKSLLEDWRDIMKQKGDIEEKNYLDQWAKDLDATYQKLLKEKMDENIKEEDTQYKDAFNERNKLIKDVLFDTGKLRADNSLIVKKTYEEYIKRAIPKIDDLTKYINETSESYYKQLKMKEAEKKKKEEEEKIFQEQLAEMKKKEEEAKKKEEMMMKRRDKAIKRANKYRLIVKNIIETIKDDSTTIPDDKFIDIRLKRLQLSRDIREKIDKEDDLFDMNTEQIEKNNKEWKELINAFNETNEEIERIKKQQVVIIPHKNKQEKIDKLKEEFNELSKKTFSIRNDTFDYENKELQDSAFDDVKSRRLSLIQKIKDIIASVKDVLSEDDIDVQRLKILIRKLRGLKVDFELTEKEIEEIKEKIKPSDNNNEPVIDKPKQDEPKSDEPKLDDEPTDIFTSGDEEEDDEPKNDSSSSLTIRNESLYRLKNIALHHVKDNRGNYEAFITIETGLMILDIHFPSIKTLIHDDKTSFIIPFAKKDVKRVYKTSGEEILRKDCIKQEGALSFRIIDKSTRLSVKTASKLQYHIIALSNQDITDEVTLGVTLFLHNEDMKEDSFSDLFKLQLILIDL